MTSRNCKWQLVVVHICLTFWVCYVSTRYRSVLVNGGWMHRLGEGGGCEGGLVIYLVDAFVAVWLRCVRAGRRDEEVVGREAEHWWSGAISLMFRAISFLGGGGLIDLCSPLIADTLPSGVRFCILAFVGRGWVCSSMRVSFLGMLLLCQIKCSLSLKKN